MNKVNKILYQSIIVIHILIVLYFIGVFILAVTGILAKMKMLRLVNLITLPPSALLLFINKYRCPLTQLQNRLAEKLNKKKLKTEFIPHLLEKIDIRVTPRTNNIAIAAMGVVIVVSAIIQ